MATAPARIFAAAASARAASLEKQWPPGFTVQAIQTHGTRDFDFGAKSNDGARPLPANPPGDEEPKAPQPDPPAKQTDAAPKDAGAKSPAADDAK